MAILVDWKLVLIAVLTISDQYTTFVFFEFCFAKWPPAAILNDRKSCSIAFLAISNQDTTLFHNKNPFFYKMDTGVHFGWPKITFNRISLHFRSICNLFHNKNHFRSHFSPVEINMEFCFTKSAILDDRKSLFITFLAISDQYTTFFYLNFFKMAAAGHFGSQKQ